MSDSAPNRPTWTPWAFIATGVLGLVIVLIALLAGELSALDAVILMASVVVIVMGVRQLRSRGSSPRE